jgi:hypothetical protein
LHFFYGDLTMFRSFNLIAVLFLLAHTAEAAQFQNLDFEQAFGGQYPAPADHLGFPDTYPLISTALPHWTLCPFRDGVNYKTMALDAPDIALVDRDDCGEVVQGNYGVCLQNVLYTVPGMDIAVSVSQTGTIPLLVDSQPTQSIRFICSGLLEDTADCYRGAYLLLNGNNIPLSVTSIDGSSYELAGDIPETLKGTETELKIGYGAIESPFAIAVVIDTIRFSNVPVPEPSTLALLLTATLSGLFWWRRRS